MMIFEYKVETFLLNLFFILFPLIFYQFIANDKISSKPLIRNVLLYAIFMVPIILCLVFPVTQLNGYSLNLHAVPFIMSCLYTNPVVSLLIYLSSMLTREMFGGEGQYLTFMYDTICYLVLYVLIHRYRAFSLPVKMVVTFCLSFTAKLAAKLVFFLFIDSGILFNLRLAFNIIEGIFMALALYTIEAVLRNNRLKRELLAGERMRVASIISASVAHEIRNPLTTVRGFVQLLSGKQKLTEEKREFYGRISLEEIDRAHQIISDYLSLARPYPEVLEKIDIAEELRYVSTVLTSDSNLEGIELRLEAESDLYIQGDRHKLRQCMINLSKNGIEAMEDGGVLELTLTRLNNRAELCISDSGKGMTPEQIGRLGTPYFSTKEKGTGLGTMVAFNIIQNMLGKTHIVSRVGEGTKFHISFPLV
jgi:two-component system sporulation sensor kinase B